VAIVWADRHMSREDQKELIHRPPTKNCEKRRPKIWVMERIYKLMGKEKLEERSRKWMKVMSMRTEKPQKEEYSFFCLVIHPTIISTAHPLLTVYNFHGWSMFVIKSTSNESGICKLLNQLNYPSHVVHLIKKFCCHGTWMLIIMIRLPNTHLQRLCLYRQTNIIRGMHMRHDVSW